MKQLRYFVQELDGAIYPLMYYCRKADLNYHRIVQRIRRQFERTGEVIDSPLMPYDKHALLFSSSRLPTRLESLQED
jgi:hypothetical protein